jgi:hypothetical protein
VSDHPNFPGGDPNKPWDKQPWDKTKPEQNEQSEGGILDAAGDAVGEGAGAVIDGLGAVAEGVGAVAEGAAGCLDGCGSCSLAMLVALFVMGGTARAAVELFK